ncbi:MAG: penicillin-binding protein 1A [Halomonadaceae bacterium]|nr:MAG: penicillin-binding protein 1A [Halomonadaceae bacterium]
MSRILISFNAVFRFLLACFAGVVLVMAAFYLYLQPGLPGVEQLRDIRLQTPLRVYSQDNQLIAEFGEMRRTPLALSQVPERQVQAFLAAEDSRFASHHGVDIRGLARAVVELASTGSIQSGGSTITMQVAKNFFLTRDRTFLRKFNEILLALQIEREISKDEILELYFNKIYLGNRAYGLSSAASVYYGSSPDDLTLAQMAMIAGLPKAPSAYNPLANPSRALARRNWILGRMLDLEYINADEYREALAEPVTARYHGPEVELEAPYVAEMAREEVFRRVGANAYTDGYQVTVTVDSKRQKAANKALRNGLEAYDRRHGYRGPLEEWDLDDYADIESLQSRLGGISTIAGLVPGVIITLEEDHAIAVTRLFGEVRVPFESMRWARTYRNENSMGPVPESPSDVVSPGHVVRLRIPVQPVVKEADSQPVMMEAQLLQLPDIQGSLVSLDPHTGAVQALVGGYSFASSNFNRATQASRQTGSAFKPLLFLAALEQGKTAASLVNDAPIVFEDDELESAWRPQNVSGRFGGPTTLREALYQSRNLVAVRLLREVGINYTLNYVGQLGLDRSTLPRDLSLSLGSGPMTPMELTRAYAIIANGGYAVEPYLIERIQGPDEEPLFVAPETVLCNACLDDEKELLEHIMPLDSRDLKPRRVMPRVADERSVYILHSMLQDVITRGTGRRAQALGRDDLAGKTGTTNDQRDTWFAGFNGSIASSAWVGFDQPRTLGRREFGGVTALPIWQQYMGEALAGTESSLMPQPPGIVTLRIDPESGKRVSSGTRNARFELFRSDNAPEEPAENEGRQDSQDQDDGMHPQQLF